MKELILVPTEELVDELRSRCRLFVAAYTDKDEVGERIQTRWSEADSWVGLLGLATILKANLVKAYHEDNEEGK